MTRKTPPRMGELFSGSTMKGFLDLPFADAENTDHADIVFLGAPIATPYASVGSYCHDAPDAVRSAFGWPGVLDHHDFDIGSTLLPDGINAVDWGNLACSDNDYSHNRDLIRRQVGCALDKGAVPIVVGGDDSTPIPVLQAYERHGPVTVVQFDAHIDWRDEVAGEHFGLSSNMRRASEMSWVTDMIQIGARGLGSARPGDHADALAWGVKFFPMRAVRQSTTEQLLASIPAGSRVFINFDIDVMDPAVVPAVIGPAPGGFDYWTVVELLTAMASRATIVGFNLAELMPANDSGGRGALVAARILAVTMALIARQRMSSPPAA